ncbi:Androgen receptor N-terminal-interacting protein [Intoshia linei]|uniref:Androgen receptor N-terminal-interacting protein n=1 Tax=Intoshia linei TaxID=1819745 RepID=A0A177B920_9BILA|nr:Androgen receptor N-terminal-interacting protein [Intoshia linei]
MAKKRLGCKHYFRKCKIIANCCNRAFWCRMCHDDACSHKINRREIKLIICQKCNIEQEVSSTCKFCNTCFGKYFCRRCVLYDDVDKKQYHCNKCRSCRVGGRDNYEHCCKCGMCILISFFDKHPCIPDSAFGNCTICLESLMESRKQLSINPCGHILHKICEKRMIRSGKFNCPICNRSIVDMQAIWRYYDLILTPDTFSDEVINIVCADCNKKSNVKRNYYVNKCKKCGSFNTAID